MIKKLKNWTYPHVASFLRENGFELFESADASQESWVKLGKTGEPEQFVELKLQSEPYSWKTLRKIIRQSEIDKEKWSERADM